MKPATRMLSIRMFAASFAAAGAIFGGLAVQMAHGHDPELGAGASSGPSRAQFDTSPSDVVTRAS